MSKSIIKFIDLSIIPAALLVLGKLIGVYLSILILGIHTTFRDYTNNILSLGPTISEKHLIAVTSYSDLFMYIFIVTFFSTVLIRAIFFHNTHVKPTLVSSLANKNLLKLVQSSYEIYHAAVIGLLFLWIATALILINAILGNSFIWVSVLAILSSITLTGMLLQDIYKEIENIKQHPGKYNWS